MNKTILFLFLCFIVSACGVHINKLEERTRFLLQNPESYQAYDHVVLQRKNIIPELIPFIADTSVVFVPSIHPWSSNLPNVLLTTASNLRGICFARLIDYYLSYTPEIEKEYQKAEKGRLGGSGRFYFYRFYDFGIIIKSDSEGAIIEGPLETEDMIAICRQYTQWWDAHKNESLSSLRKLFREEGGIIKGPYRWI